jgi:CubicO group peptidase (beta-lactamase class C family)
MLARLTRPVFLAVATAAACTAPGRDDAAGSVSAGDGAEARPRDAVAALATPPLPTTGLDSALAASAVERAGAMPRLRTLLVSRHGDMHVEEHFRGPGLDAPANVKSVSKSILSAVAGIAIADGHLTGADQAIAPFFEQYLGGDADPAVRRITVGHLLSMQSGLESTSGRNYGRWVTSPNWVRHALTRPVVTEPGGARLYSTGNSHILSATLTLATGRSTWAYARDRLAAPLGIDLPRWPADPQGVYFGGNEMRISPRAMVRFGELYRNGGRRDGRQIVPEEWVRESLTPRSAARRTAEGYGYGWFLGDVRGHPMFYAWGYGGQFIFVVPTLELTVVTTSDPDVDREREHLQAVRSLLRDYIVPAALHAPRARSSVSDRTGTSTSSSSRQPAASGAASDARPGASATRGRSSPNPSTTPSSHPSSSAAAGAALPDGPAANPVGVAGQHAMSGATTR